MIFWSTPSTIAHRMDNSVTRRPGIGRRFPAGRRRGSHREHGPEAEGDGLPGCPVAMVPLLAGQRNLPRVASRRQRETYRLNLNSRMTWGTRQGTQRWILPLAAWMVVVGGLSACTGPQGGISPTATDRSQEAPPGSPVAAVRPTPTCDEYAVLVSDPEMRAALEAHALWAEVIAELEKHAAGQQVDREHAQQLSEQLATAIGSLHESKIAAKHSATSQLAITAMRLSERSAERLGRQDLSRNGAKLALAELKQAIAAYEEQAKAEETRCGST